MGLYVIDPTRPDSDSDAEDPSDFALDDYYLKVINDRKSNRGSKGSKGDGTEVVGRRRRTCLSITLAAILTLGALAGAAYLYWPYWPLEESESADVAINATADGNATIGNGTEVANGTAAGSEGASALAVPSFDVHLRFDALLEPSAVANRTDAQLASDVQSFATKIATVLEVFGVRTEDVTTHAFTAYIGALTPTNATASAATYPELALCSPAANLSQTAHLGVGSMSLVAPDATESTDGGNGSVSWAVLGPPPSNHALFEATGLDPSTLRALAGADTGYLGATCVADGAACDLGDAIVDAAFGLEACPDFLAAVTQAGATQAAVAALGFGVSVAFVANTTNVYAFEDHLLLALESEVLHLKLSGSPVMHEMCVRSMPMQSSCDRFVSKNCHQKN